MNSILFYLAWNSIPGLGPKTLRTLLERYGNVATLFQAPPEELVQFSRIKADLARQIRQAGENLERYEQMLWEMEEQGVWLTCWEDSTYPVLLGKIDDAPPLLYLRGTWQEEDHRAVAIVGSREASAAGCELARQMAAALAERGLTVVSGFARGVDTAAHRGALEAGGRTVGVFGTGIDRLYPSSNRELAERIVRQGVLLTEFPPGTPAQGRTLMARDRIISGLSRAVIVIEAGVRSGSMDTAARARKQGRLLYAVDWSGTAVQSEGTAQLIRENNRALPSQREDLDVDALVEEILQADPGVSSGPPDPPPPLQQLALFG